MQSSIAGTLLQVKGCDPLSLSTYICRYYVLLYAVASTIGAALVFPGAGALDFGTTSLSPPFVTGLSAVFIIWVCAPIVAVSITGIGFLNARNLFARGDDPLHKTLWVRPAMLQPLHALKWLVNQLCKHLLACMPPKGSSTSFIVATNMQLTQSDSPRHGSDAAAVSMCYLAIKVHCDCRVGCRLHLVSSSQAVVVLMHVAPCLACSVEVVAALTECATYQ